MKPELFLLPQHSNRSAWGSDAIAALLGRLDIDYIAFTPGSSFRGLHDSLVNLSPEIKRPQMVMCLHEEHAVAVAHGYFKATGRIMAVALHANVGLMHASMAIFNAWCDRAAILIIGAAGPFDAEARRPWVDWLHMSADLGGLVRGYTKWDDRPVSVGASCEALIRAHRIALTRPTGPVYVCLDLTMQESPVQPGFQLPDPAWYPIPDPAEPSLEQTELVAQLLGEAKRPVLLIGRTGADATSWAQRVELAERGGIAVIQDLKVGGRFPTSHPNHVPGPGLLPGPEGMSVLREADLVISLDWIDLGGTMRHAFGSARKPEATVVHASIDHHLHNGWSMDYQALVPADLFIAADPDRLVERLLDVVSGPARQPPKLPAARRIELCDDGLDLDTLATIVNAALASRAPTYARLPIGWPGDACGLSEAGDYLGYDGSGGIGSGPGMSVGAALALRGSKRLPVAILGDGDFLMGATALWTAANQRLPLLVIVANNCSFFNDELHQDRIARARGRDPENRGIGIRMDDPATDLAQLSAAQGARGFGPAATVAMLEEALSSAVEVVTAGGIAVIDVRVKREYARGIPEAVLAKSE